jgi:hypothetical protein
MKTRLLPVAAICAGLLSLMGCTNRLGDALRAVRVIDPDPDVASNDDPTGDIAVSGTNVYASYCSYADKDLRFAKSADGGDTWPTAGIVAVDAAGNVGDKSRLFVSGDTIRILYYENYGGPGQVRKCAQSTDGGATWTVTAMVDPPNPGDLKVFSTVFFLDTLYCFYATNDMGTRRLRCARSSDRGATWPAFAEITTYAGTDPRNEYARYCAALEPATDTLVFIYSWTNELTAARSTDGGATWPAGERGTISPVGEMITGELDAAVAGSAISLVYGDSSNADIRLLRSTDGGQSWPAASVKAAEFENNTGIEVFEPSSGSLCLLMTSGDWFSSLSSADAGATWSDPTSTTMRNPRFVAGVADADTVYVLGAFHSNEATRLGLIKSTDCGASWY